MKKRENKSKLHIALAGQANVGKSVIFNHLTGLHQHLGNWPGKTVEKAEGTLHYRGYNITVLDLPGIYSLTTYSHEELVSREHIASHEPDFIVNVVDATNLERNLLLTLQLLELEQPLVLALNMANLLDEKGIRIDTEKLKRMLGIPVVLVEAIYGKGLTEILDTGIKLATQQRRREPLEYGQEVENEIKNLTKMLKGEDLGYPKRWIAIKLLERDPEIRKLISERAPQVLKQAKESIAKLEEIHGHDSSIIIADERCHLVSKITEAVMTTTKPEAQSFGEKLDFITGHSILGYIVLFGILAAVFLIIFNFGDWGSSQLEALFSNFQAWYQDTFNDSLLTSLLWAGIESALALISIALPYIIPFYLLLYLLEDSGYLARIAYLTDSLMHKLGIHGKACIPLLLGYGCNVPGCMACRIMETQRERFITAFLTTLIPCSAATVVILGLVGKFVGINWVIALYILNLLIILILGKLASKTLPGKATDLIIEVPDYRAPHFKTVLLQTWFRVKEFLFKAGPLVIFSGILIQGFYLAGWLDPLVEVLSPITVKWLGLPAITGILLIFGILRKELILVMLAALLGTSDFASVLNSQQMITLSLVSMFYIPCVATIGTLAGEFGWKKALGITIFEILFAIVISGLIARLLFIL